MENSQSIKKRTPEQIESDEFLAFVEGCKNGGIIWPETVESFIDYVNRQKLIHHLILEEDNGFEYPSDVLTHFAIIEWDTSIYPDYKAGVLHRSSITVTA